MSDNTLGVEGGHDREEGCSSDSAATSVSTTMSRYLPGEKSKWQCQDISLSCPLSAGQVNGYVYLTNYKILLHHQISEKEPVSVHELLLGLIDKVEWLEGGGGKEDGEDVINIFCKDARSCMINFSNSQRLNGESSAQARAFYNILHQLAFPISRNALPFAFFYNEQFPENGWAVYDPIKELKRLGVPNESWKIVDYNDKYEISDGYPALWAIPSAAEDPQFIRSVATFRTLGRIPILSWLHQTGQASLTRSSQPLAGTSGNRSVDDERYLQMILETNKNVSSPRKLCVVDARSQEYATSKQALEGGGYEREDVYQNIELVFVGVPGIKVIRESFAQLKEGIIECYQETGYDDHSKLLPVIESSQWLVYLQTILSGAVKIAEKIENQNTSVLVHCSFGIDKATQLSSLAMLLLDPYYRTLEGFQVLVEKEWLSAGHRFQNRTGHGIENHKDSRTSPIFLQWIDCVYQVTLQFPNAFEFNEYFLTTVLDHLYSCRFGTFLYNCERERIENEVERKTVSLWSMINDERSVYLNSLYKYDNNGPVANLVLFPTAAKKKLKFWTKYYCRWHMSIGK